MPAEVVEFCREKKDIAEAVVSIKNISTGLKENNRPTFKIIGAQHARYTPKMVPAFIR